MSNNTVIDFSVWAMPRHPKAQYGYDASTHSYRADYVNPSRWRLIMNACVGIDVQPPITGATDTAPIDVGIIDDTPSDATGPRTMGITDRAPTDAGIVDDTSGATSSRTIDAAYMTTPVSKPPPVGIDALSLLDDGLSIDYPPFEPPEMPEDILSFEWTIQDSQGNVIDRIVKDRRFEDMCVADTHVPSSDRYRITLIINYTLGRSLTATKTFALRDFLIVSLGDSLASGEGNPDVVGTIRPMSHLKCNATTLSKAFEATEVPLLKYKPFEIRMINQPSWQEAEAHRSYNSGPSLAAEYLEDAVNGTLITFLSFARSGATIDGLLAHINSDKWIDVGQIDEAVRTINGRPIDALVLSIGGNDVGFANTLEFLVKDWLVGRDITSPTISRAREKIAQLPEKLGRLNRAIRQKLNPRFIFITEYPIGLFDVRQSDGAVVTQGGCEIFASDLKLSITSQEAQDIKQAGRELNATIREFARANGWFFVTGVAEGPNSFEGHGYCADDSYFVSAEYSCKTQGDFEGTMHPNGVGHRLYGRLIAQAIRPRLALAPPPARDTGGMILTDSI